MLILFLLVEIFCIFKTVKAYNHQKNNIIKNDNFGKFEWWMILSGAIGISLLVGFVQRYTPNLSIPLATVATIFGVFSAIISIKESFKTGKMDQ